MLPAGRVLLAGLDEPSRRSATARPWSLMCCRRSEAVPAVLRAASSPASSSPDAPTPGCSATPPMPSCAGRSSDCGCTATCCGACVRRRRPVHECHAIDRCDDAVRAVHHPVRRALSRGGGRPSSRSSPSRAGCCSVRGIGRGATGTGVQLRRPRPSRAGWSRSLDRSGCELRAARIATMTGVESIARLRDQALAEVAVGPQPGQRRHRGVPAPASR
jgi:hypothetical protein